MVKVRSYKKKDGTIVSSHNRTYNYSGKKYQIKKSNLKNKQLVAISPSGKKVHFGDPKMPEFRNTIREDNYCARSYGIKNKQGEPTRNDPNSANFWSRRVTWQCRGKKSANI